MTAQRQLPRRLRKRVKHAAGNITRLRDGRFRIDCVDSYGTRHRPAFATMEQATAALDRIAAKKSRGEFLAGAANTTFDKALDLLIENNDRRELTPATRYRVQSVIRAHLRPAFGKYKLNDFPAQRMRFVQEWFDHRAKQHGAAAMTLAHLRSNMKMAFDEAIRDGLMAPPNPVTEFGLRIPHVNEKIERECLTLEEISELVRTSLRRADAEHELTFRTRFMMVMIGMLTGLRNEECSGLYWDCVDFDGRMIFVRRIWRKGVGIVATTKTGKSGFRSVPMSPLLYAALRAHADRLQALGFKVTGEAPVLVTTQAKIVLPSAISAQHWVAAASKAGFIDTDGGLKHTYYALRHTAANLWRTVGIQPDRLMRLMGHMSYETTCKNYLHETPHFEPIRREVEELIEQRRVERTVEGFIDGIGVALFRRWREEGIEIECAPLRSATPKIGHAAAPLALPGKTIDLSPAAVSIGTPGSPIIKTIRELQAWQRQRAKELFLSGWTRADIATELGIATPTLNEWLSNLHSVRLGRLPAVQRQELMQRIGQLQQQHPEWSATQIAKTLGVETRRITYWARRLGNPMRRIQGNYRLGKYAADIERMVAQRMTYRQMAEELKRKYPDRKTPSESGIGYYLKNRGVKTPRWKGGLRIENYDALIREMVAAGKHKEQIARELGIASRTGILEYIKRLGLQPVRGNPAKRITRT